MSEIRGIDVSKHQGDIDWSAVKASGIQFVIIRAGYGKLASQKDVKFEEFYAGAKKVGLPVGAYWYSYATSASEANEEAEACYECIKGKSFEYPIFFDYEDKCQTTPEIAREVIPAFISNLVNKGYYVDLYSYKNVLSTVIPEDIKKRYGIWLAHYASSTTYTGHNMWQYASDGQIGGIGGNVDMNICYIDYPARIKASGKSNGGAYSNTTKPVVEAAKPKVSAPKSVAAAATISPKVISKGDAVTLSNTSLYASASSTNNSGTKTGTYYIYNGEKVSGRYAITNEPGNVDKQPMGKYVTGWVDASAIGGSNTTASAPRVISKGDTVTLSNTSIYASASGTTAAGTKTGTYYIYNGEKVSGRYAITNETGNVDKQPMGKYVTGWVDASAVK